MRHYDAYVVLGDAFQRYGAYAMVFVARAYCAESAYRACGLCGVCGAEGVYGAWCLGCIWCPVLIGPKMLKVLTMLETLWCLKSS